MNAFTSLIRRVPKISNIIVRNYAREPFSMKWTRPEVPSCISTEKSGDLGLDYKINPKEPCQFYQNVPEMENCDENIKKIFSLEFNYAKKTAKLKSNRAISLVESHDEDKSFEVRIARLTSEIHNLQEIMKNNPSNKQCKVALKNKIEKRQKYLRVLRTVDYKRFEWVLEQLNLIYKPLPEFHMVVTRKGSLRALAKMHCDKIVGEKLEAYKNELKSQQKSFYEKKAKHLAFIREEEIFCGVEPTVTEEDIEIAKQMAAEL